MLDPLLQILLSGVVGFVGGAGALLMQQRFVWRPQKRTELRTKIFDDAVQTLSRYEAEAIDPVLQASWQNPHVRPHIVLRDETRVSLQRSRSQVKAFFPPKTFLALDAALRANVSITNIPNTDFTEKSDKAIKLMAHDLGLL